MHYTSEGVFQRCTSGAELTSVCARSLSPRRTHHHPLSPPICLVCALLGGTNGFIAKLPPAGVLTGIKILPYERGQRTREGNFSQLRDKFSRSDSLKDKRVDGWGDDCGRAPARPRNGGVPSTARPSHLGGRASGTWPDKEKSESGDEIDKRSAAFPLRCLRGALHL